MNGYKKETRVTRLFVGKGDFSAQDAHAKACDNDGWYVAADVHDPRYHEALKDVKGSIVVIHGADAEACVPFGAAHAIANGAERVVIPLTRIMTKGEGNTPLRTRARKLLQAFTAFQQSATDIDKLTVTPTKIWRATRASRK